MKPAVALVAFPLLLAGCLMRGDPVSPYGRRATVHHGRQQVSTGELLAVQRDSVWLMHASGVRAFAVQDVAGVIVRRHRMNGWRTMQGAAIVGAGVGLALGVACARYEATEEGRGAGCMGVAPGAFLGFVLAAMPFAVFNEYSSRMLLPPTDSLRLRAHARFPQGASDSTLRTLTPPSPRMRAP